MNLDLQPEEPKDDNGEWKYTPPPQSEDSRFIIKALAGFLISPLLIAASLAAQTGIFFFLLIVGAAMMLFFKSTRAFGLGAILFVGVAFLLLLAICGHSNF